MTTIDANTPTSAYSDLLSTGVASSGHLTADALMIYLQERLTSVDDQINAIMEKQRKTEATRKLLQEMQNNLAAAGENGLSREQVDELQTILDQFEDKSMQSALREQLGIGTNHKYGGDERKITEAEMEGSTVMIDNLMKDLESSAQLDMIKLQSLMSTRNSAISLATNMMAAVGKGLESIVGNIGR